MWPDLPPLAWASFSVGGAFLITGTITGIVTLNHTSDLEERCKTRCYESEIASNMPRAHLATASFAIAGAGIGLGLLAILLDEPAADEPAQEPTDGVALRPLIGPFMGVEGAL